MQACSGLTEPRGLTLGFPVSQGWREGRPRAAARGAEPPAEAPGPRRRGRR